MFKRFIRIFFDINNFLINSFIVIPIKGTMNLLDKMLERVNRGNQKCVTPLFNSCFECNDEQSTSSILTINFIIDAKFQKTNGVLKNGCSTLAVKFQIWKVLIYPWGNFQIHNYGKTCWSKELGRSHFKIRKVQTDFMDSSCHLTLVLLQKTCWRWWRPPTGKGVFPMWSPN